MGLAFNAAHLTNTQILEGAWFNGQCTGANAGEYQVRLNQTSQAVTAQLGTSLSLIVLRSTAQMDMRRYITQT